MSSDINNTVVVDTNIALKWVLVEEDSGTARALLAQWTRTGTEILAPSLLIYEATNILYREIRAGKITFETAKNGINLILRTIVLMHSNWPTTSLRAMALAERFKLPAAYDTQYLALAELEDCEFWTTDTRIWSAVKNQFPWVRLLSDYSPSL
jgi:predicted nucleic acid-binding protein